MWRREGEERGGHRRRMGEGRGWIDRGGEGREEDGDKEERESRKG